MNKNSRFGAIGIALVVAAVGLVGFIGWRLVDANSAKKETSDNQQPSTSQTNNNSSTLPADAATYLDIKELGVRIKLDDKTQGTTYVNVTPASDGADGIFVIAPAMKAIDNGNQYCKGATAGLIGILDRSKDQIHWGTPLVVNNTDSFKLGDYYFHFRSPQAECSQDTAISEQRAQHIQDFLNILKTMQLNQ